MLAQEGEGEGETTGDPLVLACKGNTARLKLIVTPGAASEAIRVPLTLSFTTTINRGPSSRTPEVRKPLFRFPSSSSPWTSRLYRALR